MTTPTLVEIMVLSLLIEADNEVSGFFSLMSSEYRAMLMCFGSMAMCLGAGLTIADSKNKK